MSLSISQNTHIKVDNSLTKRNANVSMSGNTTNSTKRDVVAVPLNMHKNIFMGSKLAFRGTEIEGFTRRDDGGYDFEYKPGQKVTLYRGCNDRTLWINSQDSEAILTTLDKIDQIRQLPVFGQVENVQYAGTNIHRSLFWQVGYTNDRKPIFETTIDKQLKATLETLKRQEQERLEREEAEQQKQQAKQKVEAEIKNLSSWADKTKRFSSYEQSNIADECDTEEKLQALKALLRVKAPDGKDFRNYGWSSSSKTSDEYELIDILKAYQPGQINILQDLASRVAQDGKNNRFSGSDIGSILNACPAEKQAFLNQLLELSINSEQLRAYNIANILPKWNSDSDNILIDILKLAQTDKKLHPYHDKNPVEEAVTFITNQYKSEYNEATNYLLNLKTFNSEGKEVKLINNINDLSNLYENVGQVYSSEVVKNIETLLKSTKLDNKEKRFEDVEAVAILNAYTSAVKYGSTDLFDLLFNKVKTGVDNKQKYAYDGFEIYNIIRNCTDNKKRLEFAKGIISGKKQATTETFESKRLEIRNKIACGFYYYQLDRETKAKVTDGSFDLKAYADEFVKVLTPVNIKYFDQLANREKSPGSVKVSQKHEEFKREKYEDSLNAVSQILPNIVESNEDCVNSLVTSKNDNNDNWFWRYHGVCIPEILQVLKDDPSKKPYFTKYFNLKNKNGEYRLDDFKFAELLKAVNDSNEKYLDRLLASTLILNNEAISTILSLINQNNLEILEYLFPEKAPKKALIKYDRNLIKLLSNNLTDKDLPKLKLLVSYNGTDGKKFNETQIAALSLLCKYELPIEKILNYSKIENLTSVEMVELLNFLQDFASSSNEKVFGGTQIMWDKTPETGVDSYPLLSRDFSERKALAMNIFARVSEDNTAKPISEEVLKPALQALESIDNSLTNFDFQPYAKTGLKLNQNGQFEIPENPALAQSLNAITKAFPEFLQTVGLKQHETHEYTLDIHILKTLQEVIKDEAHKGSEYNSLSAEDKKIAKLSVLFHDISKEEGSVDPSHPFRSAIESYKILKRTAMPEKDLRRIFEFICNHHWAQEIAEKRQQPEDIAFDFRRPGDFKIASLFAIADLKSVGNGFAEANNGEKMNNLVGFTAQVSAFVDQIHSSGIYLPQTRIPKAADIKKLMQNAEISGVKEVDGTVIIKVDDVKDFEQLGFDKGTERSNFGVICHAIAGTNPDVINNIHYGAKFGTDAVLCTTYETPDKFNTYYNYPYGFIFNADNNDLGLAKNENIGSGCKKGLVDFRKFYLPKEEIWQKSRYPYSQTMKDLINKNPVYKKAVERFLDQPGQPVDYKELYKKLSGYSSLTDIKGDENKALRDLIQETIKIAVLSPKAEHNEIDLYSPKISAIFASTNYNFKCVPSELAEYARNNNIPVLIFNPER